MPLYTFQRRLSATTVSLSMMLALLLPSVASASGSVSLEFRPHCDGDAELGNVFGGPIPDIQGMTKLTEGTCYTYEVRDPSSLQTSVLHAGDTLDMDIMVNNPDNRPISRFRAWIAYDPTILEGIDMAVNPSFPVPTPGELGFVPTEGAAKLSGTSTIPISSPRFALARVRFRILADNYEGTPLTYIEATGTADAKTGMFEGTTPNEQNALVPVPGSLFVRLANTTISSAISSQGSLSSAAQQNSSSVSVISSAAAQTVSSVTSITSQSSSAVPQKIFSMLQVLGLRVTTDGSSVFLAWDALPSAELAGYNVYYGTVSGRYIQRRGVDKSANSLTIRSLPIGTTYYFAVRGVNDQNEETVFSQEVAVSVGNPRTSTSPLNASTLPTKTPGTNGQITGDTGVSSTYLIAVLTCAVIGTLIAARRQMQLSRI